MKSMAISLVAGLLILVNFYLKNFYLGLFALILCLYNLMNFIKSRNEIDKRR